MNISINNMGGSSQTVSSLISQLISKRSQSMNSLLDQKSSIESMLSQLQSGGLGSGSLDSSYSSQISSLQDTIDRLNRQYSINSNKITTINSLKNSYNSTVSSLQRYLDSLKNPNSSGGDLDIFLDGNKGSSNGNVGVVINDKNTNIQQVDLTVTQLATTSVLKSGKLTGGSVNLNTKLTDLFAGEYDSVKNSVKTTRDDLKSNMKMSELGVTSGSFSIGGTTINIDADNDTVGSVMTKLQNAGYDAKIETTGYDDSGNAIGRLVITGTGGKSLAITNQTTNFASLAGLTVSTGNFTINGQSFNVTSSSTVGSLINEINYATADGVGAKLENGQLVFVASKTGEVEINIGKGTSNFTNAIGFTVGGVMNKDNLVMGTDGSYVTLTGQNTNVKLSDSVSGGKFTAGSFSITHNKIDSNGTVLNEMVTTRIDVTSSDTVSTIIDKIKSQTAFTYTDKDGKTVNGGLTAEVVDGKFRIMQKEKGVDYKISVEAGSSTFTNYVGLTSSVSSGTAVSGSSSTLTGINNVTSSMTFNAGAFKISASSANNSSVMETKTIDVAQGESLASVISKINGSGLAVTASIQDNKLVLTHKNYGENFKIEVEAGSTDFTNKVGFTKSTSVGTSNNGTSSYVLGTATGMTNTTAGFTNGSFVIKTNALSADGKTADSKMLSATIEVTSSDTLESVMQKIKDANIGLTAEIESGKLKISQVNGGEGFDIVVEAGDTNFTQKTGLTNSVSVGVSSTASSSYVLGTKTVPNSGFSAGSFTISTNKLSADGKSASSEMISATIDVTASDTKESIAQKITDAGIGLTATITSEGKIKIEQNNSGSGFDIKIQAGATDFTDKAGLTTSVTNDGVLSPGRDVNQYTTLTGNGSFSGGTLFTAGTFKINGVTLDLEEGGIISVIDKINTYSSQTGVNAYLKDGKVVLQSNVTGADTNIYVEDGTSNFGSLSGLISSSSMGGSAVLGQVGSKTTLTGSNSVTNDTVISSGTIKINGFDVILSGGTLADAVTKINQASAETGVTAAIKDNKLVLTNVKTGASGILVEEGSSDIARITGISAYQTKAGTEEIKGQTKTALVATQKGLTGNEMISSSSILLNGTKISFSGTVNNAIAEINKLTGTTGVKALIDEQGRFTLVNEATGAKSIGLTFESGDFGKVIGAVSSNVSGGTTVTTPGGSYVQGGNGGLTNGSGIMGGGSIIIGNGDKPDIGNNGTITGSKEISIAMVLSEVDAIAQGYTVIKTAEDLAKLNGSSGKFVLMDDIDVTGMQLGFNFSGTLEGNGFTISGGNSSLFGTVSNASINNLIISKFSMGGMNTGIFAQTISNSNVSNILIIDSIFSYSNGTSTSSNSAFAHTVSGMSTTIKNISIRSDVKIYTSTGQASAFINTGTNLASGAISNVISNAELSGSNIVTNKLYNSATTFIVTNTAYNGLVNGTRVTVGTVDDSTQGYKYGSRTVVYSGTTSINGVEVSYASDEIAHAINEINKKSSETGVFASIVNNKVVFKNVDGSKRDIKVNDVTGNFAATTGTDTRTIGVSGIHMSESEAISKGYTVVKTAQEFMDAVNASGNRKIMLMGNIDFTGLTYTTVESFSGELNGNGYSLSNITVDSANQSVGLFNNVTDATIKNIVFDQIRVKGNTATAAGLLGGFGNNVTIDTVGIRGGFIDGNAGFAGGLIGYGTDITVKDSAIIGFQFDSSSATGGFIGSATGNVSIADSMLFYGLIDGTTAGGFIGSGDFKVTITNSYSASGSTSANFGGVFGSVNIQNGSSFNNVGMLENSFMGSSGSNPSGIYQMAYLTDFSAPSFSSSYLGANILTPTKLADMLESSTLKEEATYGNSGTGNFAKVDLTGLTTIGQVIDKINGMNAGVTASLENGKFTITRSDGSKEAMWIGYDGEGNFGGVTGLEDYTVGVASGFGTGSSQTAEHTQITAGRSVRKSTYFAESQIHIFKDGFSKSINISAMSTLDDVVAAINSADAGVTASLVDKGDSTYYLKLTSTTAGSTSIFVAGSSPDEVAETSFGALTGFYSVNVSAPYGYGTTKGLKTGISGDLSDFGDGTLTLETFSSKGFVSATIDYYNGNSLDTLISDINRTGKFVASLVAEGRFRIDLDSAAGSATQEGISVLDTGTFTAEVGLGSMTLAADFSTGKDLVAVGGAGTTTLTSGRSIPLELSCIAAQTITITKNGVSKNVSWAANSNLEDMVNAINSANAGVTARLVKDTSVTGSTSSYFVEIKSTTTGADTISISGTDKSAASFGGWTGFYNYDEVAPSNSRGEIIGYVTGLRAGTTGFGNGTLTLKTTARFDDGSGPAINSFVTANLSITSSDTLASIASKINGTGKFTAELTPEGSLNIYLSAANYTPTTLGITVTDSSSFADKTGLVKPTIQPANAEYTTVTGTNSTGSGSTSTSGNGNITGAKVAGMTGSTNFAGLKDGTITFKYKKYDGTEASASINVSSTDTVDSVLSKIAKATVDSTTPGQPSLGFGFTVENGQIKINPGASKLLSIESDTSGFTKLAGLSTTGFYQKENATSGVKSDTTALLGSVSGLTESSILGVNAAGSYTLKLQNGSDFTFTISSTDTIKDIINKIDASGTFTAGLDAQGKFYIQGKIVNSSGGGSTGPVGPNEIVGTKDVSTDHILESELIGQGYAGYTVIRNAQDFLNIQNNLSGKYVLAADIDLSSLGTLSSSVITGTFKGELFGNGYSLSNLEIDSSDYNVGLFSKTDGAFISHLNLVNANISGGRFIGGIVGNATNNTNILSVDVIGGNIGNSGACNVGGIVGDIKDSTVSKSSVQGTSINGYDGVGGIVGSGIGYIANSYATASVSGYGRVGGIIGLMGGTSLSSVNASYFNGSVSGRTNVGGIVGQLTNSASVSSSSYWNTSKVANGVGVLLESAVFSGKGLTSSQMSGENMKPGLGSDWNYSSSAAPTFKVPGISISGGTIVVNGESITLNSGSISNAVTEINKKTSVTGVVASIENSKLVFKNAEGVTTGVSVQEGTSDLYKKAGLSGSSFTKMTEAQATAQGYTVVKTADEFINAVRSSSNSKIVLMNDIDLAGADLSRGMWLDNKVLDGNGFVLKNVTRDSSMGSDFGIFEYINNSTVKNLGLSNIEIFNLSPTVASNMGILTGNATSSSFENIYVENSSVDLGSPDGYSSSGNSVGGLIGKATDVKIDNVMIYSSKAGILHGMYQGNSGGLIGNLAGTSNSISNVSIVDSAIYTSGGPSGGVVGRFSDNSVAVTFSDMYIDGITFKDYYAAGNGYAEHSQNGILAGIMYAGNPIGVSNIKYVSSEASKLFGMQTYTSPEVTGYANSSALQQAFKNSTSSAFENSTSGKAIQKSLANVLGSKMSPDLGVNVRPTYGGSGSSGVTTPVLPNKVTGSKDVSASHLTEAEAISQGYTVIKNISQLQGINSNLSGKYILMGDIDLSSLGTLSNSLINGTFTGTLNGNGYSISNLKINSSSSYVGLFSKTNGATINNLDLVNANISGAGYVGGIVGQASTTAVMNVNVVGGSIGRSGSSNVGGIFGDMANGNISMSSVRDVNINGYDCVGGLSGNGTGNIVYSYSSATISGYGRVGGLAGLLGGNNSNVVGSYSNSSVSATYNNLGALVGCLAGWATVEKSYWNTDKTSAPGCGLVMEEGLFDTTNKGLSSAQMTNSSNMYGFDSYSWDFSGSAAPTLKKYPLSFSNVGAGTIIVNGETITLSAGTIASAVGKINEKSSLTGVIASIENNKLVFNALTSSTKGVSISAGTSDIYSIAGLESTIGSGGASSVGKLTEAEAIVQGYTVIKTAQDLQNMKNNLSGKYMLMGDIDLAGFDWTSIGVHESKLVGSTWTSNEVAFAGIFDGNGYSIKNLTTATYNGQSAGLFAYIDGAEIRNLDISNADVSMNYTDAVLLFTTGALVGTAKNSIIENITVRDSVIDSKGSSGLIVGHSNSTYINNVHVFNSEIVGGHLNGGLVGEAFGGTLSNSSADIKISNTPNYAGGLVGAAYDVSISNSFATGNIVGGSNVGGLVGYGNIFDINSSYSKTSVVASEGGVSGGLVGRNGYDGDTFTNTISNCFYDIESSGQANAIGVNYQADLSTLNVTGLTSAQMGQASSFSGWDTSVWDFSGAAPTLKSAATPPVGGGSTGGVGGVTIVSNGSGQFDKMTGLNESVTNGSLSETLGSNGNMTVTGSTKDMQLSQVLGGLTNGKFTITQGDVTVDIDVASTDTVQNLIDKINATGKFSAKLNSQGQLEIAKATTTTTTSVKKLTEAEAIAQGYTVIKSAQQLQDINNNLDGKYILMGDIDLAGFDWTSIASNDSLDGSVNFTGVLDGNGYTIKNLTQIKHDQEGGVGLFANMDNAEIKNLKLENFNLSVTGTPPIHSVVAFNAGALASIARNSTISNVDVTGSMKGNGGVGGLLGYAESSVISDVSANVTLSGVNEAEKGNPEAYYVSTIGGIAGTISNSSIINSSAKGTINNALRAGGLVGGLGWDSGTLAIKNSYADFTMNVDPTLSDKDGTLVSQAVQGGLVGSTQGSNSSLSIENSYAIGSLSDASTRGAIVGKILADYTGTVTIKDTYSSLSSGSATASVGNANGVTYTDNSKVLTTAQMGQASSFTGWDSSVWDFSGAKPTLKETSGSSVTSGGSNESITFGGSSNASELLGFKSTTVDGSTQVTGTADKRSTLTGTAAVTENMTFSSGNFVLSLGSKSQEFTTYDGETLTSVMNKINTSDLGVSASIQDGKLVFTSKDSSSDLISLKDGTSNFAELTGFIGSGGGQAVTAVKGVLSTYTSVNTANNAQNQGFSAGTFFVHLTDNDGNITGTKEITIGKNEDINSIIGKINGSGLGVTASINDSGKMVITRNSSATAGGVLVTKGSSDFTHKIGYTSGGGQSVVTQDGTSASITSSNAISNSARFTAGDFTIRLTGENAADINIQIAATDSIQMIVDKINAKGAGITASLDSNNKLVLTRDSSKGDGAIEVVKGSSNFTNVAGFTNGGYQTASTVEGVTASIKSVSSASSSTRFSAGNFVISLTGDNAKDVSIDITASDSIYDIVDKINASGAGVTAYIDSNKKMVITRDAGTGEGAIEIKKGTSDFTKVMGFSTGGDENGVFESGTTSTITSKTSANTAMATGYHSGDFFIKLTDKNGAVQKTITVNVGNTGTNGAVDNIAKIIESINSQNAGVTASLDSNGKLVLKRDESQGAGSLIVEKGTSDFTNVIGLTDGGNFNGTAEDGVAATHTVLTSNRLAVSNRATLASLGITNGSFSINGVEIAVRATDTIDDVIGKINSTFSDPKYKDIGVTAEFKNNQIVLTSKKASSNARIEIESGSTNFTQVVGLTDTVSRGNAVDLGQNAKFNIKLGNDLVGKDFDLALDLKDITNDGIYNGNNLIYLDVNGKVVMEANNAAITIEIKKTGETVIKLGQNLLDASINELNKFVGSFNKAMIASENEILSDDAEFTKFINKIKSAMTSDVADIRKVTQQLAKIGIVVDVRGGTDSNMGTVRLSVDREAYSKAFYEDSQNVMNLLVGKDTAVGMADGVLTRLNNVLYPEVKNNSGYFNKTPRQLEAVQKELKREITSTTFDLNELKNAVAGDGINTGVADYLSQLEQQYQLIQDAINNLNKQYSTSMMRLVLNKNNSSFNPIVS